ncbi:hypothetical protein D9M68_447940 [compost metagenome]
MHQRAHHVGHEAHALLVGERGDHEGAQRLALAFVEPAHHLQTGHHAVVAVVAPARGHGVDVRAGHHGLRIGQLAGADAEDVADAVDAHGEAQVAHPLHEPVAARAVGIGERDAADAALRGRADGGVRVDARHQCGFGDAFALQPLRLRRHDFFARAAGQRAVHAGRGRAFGAEQQHARAGVEAGGTRQFGVGREHLQRGKAGRT